MMRKVRQRVDIMPAEGKAVSSEALQATASPAGWMRSSDNGARAFRGPYAESLRLVLLMAPVQLCCDILPLLGAGTLAIRSLWHVQAPLLLPAVLLKLWANGSLS